MAIGPIEMQGQILRTQDYSAMKHQDDVKAEVVQNNITQNRQVEGERNFNRVSQSEQSSKQQMNKNASDKGSNEYAGDGGKNRNEARRLREQDGKVLIKGVAHINTSV